MFPRGSLLKGSHGLQHELSLFKTTDVKGRDVDRQGLAVNDQLGDHFSHSRAMLKPVSAKTVSNDKSFNSRNPSQDCMVIRRDLIEPCPSSGNTGLFQNRNTVHRIL